MRGILLALLFLAQPLGATQPAWPALHDVIDVTSDDRLNVRAAPTARADIIGSFGPSDRGIEIIRPNADETWGLVNIDEGVGWVSLRFLDRQPDQWRASYPRITACFGAEPFWDIQLGPDTASFRTPERNVSATPPVRLQSISPLDRFGLVMETDNGTLRGILLRQRCTDGMSDQEFGLSIDLIYRDEVMLSGCCTLAK
ncbi:MAG: peptide-binding protein [Pseudomonadota bacterium]